MRSLDLLLENWDLVARNVNEKSYFVFARTVVLREQIENLSKKLRPCGSIKVFTLGDAFEMLANNTELTELNAYWLKVNW